MWPHLVTFTERMLNGKVHFLCSGGDRAAFKDPVKRLC